MQPLILTLMRIYAVVCGLLLSVLIKFIAVASPRACGGENIHGCIYFSMETTSIPVWNSHPPQEEKKEGIFANCLVEGKSDSHVNIMEREERKLCQRT